MLKYDIQVTISVLGRDEAHAEQDVKNFLKNAEKVLDAPQILDWEFTEFVPADLKNSCCC